MVFYKVDGRTDKNQVGLESANWMSLMPPTQN